MSAPAGLYAAAAALLAALLLAPPAGLALVCLLHYLIPRRGRP